VWIPLKIGGIGDGAGFRNGAVWHELRSLQQRWSNCPLIQYIHRNLNQIDGVLKKYSIDLIQVPVNILDQRLIKSGHLKELKTAGVEVHARSVFLQGLMLMNPAELSDFFNSIKPHLTNYHAVLMEHGYTPVQAALDFIRSIGQIDVVICGVNSLKQLSELMDGFNSEKGADGLFSEFGIDAPEILNPALWGR